MRTILLGARFVPAHDHDHASNAILGIERRKGTPTSCKELFSKLVFFFRFACSVRRLTQQSQGSAGATTAGYVCASMKRDGVSLAFFAARHQAVLVLVLVLVHNANGVVCRYTPFSDSARLNSGGSFP